MIASLLAFLPWQVCLELHFGLGNGDDPLREARETLEWSERRPWGFHG
jgi:hypothetical protein